MKAKEQVNVGVVPISGSQYTTLNEAQHLSPIK
jgi:hypothetical protein